MRRGWVVARHRAATLYQPGDTCFKAALLLCVGFGMATVGSVEAAAAGDMGWSYLFTAMVIADVGLYLRIIAEWLFWVSPSGD